MAPLWYCVPEFESLFQKRFRFLGYFHTFRSPFSTTLSIKAKYKIYRLAWKKALTTISGLYSVVGDEEREGKPPTTSQETRLDPRHKTKLHSFLIS